MIFDVAILGAGAAGCSAALHLARGGMQVALLDRGAICGEASGMNAGVLAMRAMPPPLIPYALRAREMWLRMPEWCDGGTVHATARSGLSLAFTAEEAAMLEARRASGAPIELVSGGRAMEIAPGLSDRVLLAGLCATEGLVGAHLTGRAFRPALLRAGVALFEGRAARGLDKAAWFTVDTVAGPLRARRLVLAGGASLGEMAAWLGLRLPVEVAVTTILLAQRMRPVLRSVLGGESGLLALAQHGDGSVVIGGGRERVAARAGLAVRPEQMRALARLAEQAVPALREARILRAWLAPQAETPDALPVLGPVPGIQDAWIIGADGGTATAPCLGMLLAEAMLGEAPDLPLFPPDRLLAMEHA